MKVSLCRNTYLILPMVFPQLIGVLMARHKILNYLELLEMVLLLSPLQKRIRFQQ